METTYQEQSPSNKYYMISFLILLATILGVVFYVKPLWDEVTSLSLGRDDMLGQKIVLQAKLSGLQQVQQAFNRSSEVSRETSLASIPEKLDEDKLIGDIVKVARENDVSMSGISFSISPTSQAGQIASAGINLSLTGTEGALINFLRGIEANGRKIVVKTVAVQKASAQSGVPLVNFSISMETYYQGLI